MIDKLEVSEVSVANSKEEVQSSIYAKWPIFSEAHELYQEAADFLLICDSKSTRFDGKTSVEVTVHVRAVLLYRFRLGHWFQRSV